MASPEGETVRSVPRISVRYARKRLDYKVWWYCVMGLPSGNVNALTCSQLECLPDIASFDTWVGT